MSPPRDSEVTRIEEALNDVLDEISESKVSFAEIKVQLTNAIENIKELSKLVKDGNNGESLVVKIALLEQCSEDLKSSVKEIKERINSEDTSLGKVCSSVAILEDFKKKIEEEKNKQTTQIVQQPQIQQNIDPLKAKTIELTEKESRWKLYFVIATGIISIIGTVLAIITSLNH